MQQIRSAMLAYSTKDNLPTPERTAARLHNEKERHSLVLRLERCRLRLIAYELPSDPPGQNPAILMRHPFNVETKFRVAIIFLASSWTALVYQCCSLAGDNSSPKFLMRRWACRRSYPGLQAAELIILVEVEVHFGCFTSYIVVWDLCPAPTDGVIAWV